MWYNKMTRMKKTEIIYEVPIADNGWIETFRKVMPKHRFASVLHEKNYSGEYVKIEVSIDVERKVLYLNIKGVVQ